MTFFSRAVWLVCLLGMLSACGQKGKLVMPVKPPPVSTPYPTALPKDSDGDDTPPAASTQKLSWPVSNTGHDGTTVQKN